MKFSGNMSRTEGDTSRMNGVRIDWESFVDWIDFDGIDSDVFEVQSP
jgi:hypothetical protein